MDDKELIGIVESVVKGVLGATAATQQSGARVPVEVSARHVHLSHQDVERLFGAGHKLTHKRDLSQPGQFLCEERVTLVGPKGVLTNVAVLGPERAHTQVELSATDTRTVGVKAPVRLSGKLAGCPSIFIQAGDKLIQADESVMVAQNHIHMLPSDATAAGVHDGEIVSVRMETERPVTFDNVVIRVTDTSALAMHIDFDEANACLLGKGGTGVILKGAPTGAAPVATQPAPAAPAAAPAPAAAACTEEKLDTLLTAETAQDIVKRGITKLVVMPGGLVTPLAKDVLRGGRVEVTRCEE